MATLTLDEQILAAGKALAAKNAEVAASEGEKARIWSSYQGYANAGDWDTANQRKAQAEEQDRTTSYLQAAAKVLANNLSALNAQKDAQTQAATAAALQVAANANLTNSQANLSPEQLYNLQQAQIKMPQ